MPQGDSAEVAAFGRLLEKWLVLAYRDDDEWYDLHPLVKRAPLVASAIAEPPFSSRPSAKLIRLSRRRTVVELGSLSRAFSKDLIASLNCLRSASRSWASSRSISVCALCSCARRSASLAARSAASASTARSSL